MARSDTTRGQISRVLYNSIKSIDSALENLIIVEKVYKSKGYIEYAEAVDRLAQALAFVQNEIASFREKA